MESYATQVFASDSDENPPSRNDAGFDVEMNGPPGPPWNRCAVEERRTWRDRGGWQRSTNAGRRPRQRVTSFVGLAPHAPDLDFLADTSAISIEFKRDRRSLATVQDRDKVLP